MSTRITSPVKARQLFIGFCIFLHHHHSYYSHSHHHHHDEPNNMVHLTGLWTTPARNGNEICQNEKKLTSQNILWRWNDKQQQLSSNKLGKPLSHLGQQQKTHFEKSIQQKASIFYPEVEMNEWKNGNPIQSYPYHPLSLWIWKF